MLFLSLLQQCSCQLTFCVVSTPFPPHNFQANLLSPGISYPRPLARTVDNFSVARG